MKRTNFLICFLLFLLLLFFFTYPLLLKMDTAIPGFHSTDESYAALWYNWRIQNAFVNKLSLTHTDLVSYPFGLDLFSSKIISSGWLLWVHLLSILTNPVFCYNFQVITNIMLIWLFAYFLSFYVTRDIIAAMFSSIILAFCPYQFARCWQHLSLTYNQFLVMALFAIFLFKEHPNRKYAFLFLASILGMLTFDFSIAYMGMVMLASFFVYIIFYQWRIKIFQDRRLFITDLSFLKKAFSVLLISAVILSAQFLPILINRLRISPITPASAHNPYHRAFEDLFMQSARPLSYFMPAPTHPIFGKITEQFVGTTLYGESFTEHALYLGWIPLIFAFIAFKRRRLNSRKGEPGRENFYIGFFLWLALVSWFFSQPPWWKIGPVKIYMPSFFMYKILPMYRAYCRFGIAVMLAVSVLAGYGLKFYLERFNKKARALLVVLFFGLVLFEFWNYPPFKIIDVSRAPAVYYWLKNEPKDFIIAEYPLDADSPNEMYKFYQTVHAKKMINGTIPGTFSNKVSQTIKKISNPHTASILRWMGVKYVLVHHDGYLQTDLIEDRDELAKIPDNLGLKLTRTFNPQDCPNKDIICTQSTGPIDVYQVVAPAEAPKP